MLAAHLRRLERPVHYAAGDALDSYLLPQTRAFDLPRILGKPKVRLDLQHPLLGLLDSTVKDRDPTSAHILGDPLNDMQGDTPILQLLRQFHQHVNPVVAGHLANSPDVIRWLAAHKQATTTPAVSRNVEHYLSSRRPNIEYLLDLAAEHDIHADYDSYKDNHGLKTLLSLYDAMGALRAKRGITGGRNFGADTGTNSGGSLMVTDNSPQKRAETVQRSIAHQLHQSTLPLIGRMAGPLEGVT